MRFKRILCAVDFSPESIEAFHIALEIARLHSGSLHLFHVIEAQPLVSQWLPNDAMGKVAVEIQEKASAAMESLVGSARQSLAGSSLTSEVTSGRGFVEIVRRAEQWDADLIVLGSRGVAGTLMEAFVGSTAERVMKEAGCSVLIARKPEARTTDGESE